MQTLTQQEVNEVNGGIIPAIYAGIMTYNALAGLYGGATVAAWGAGAAAGLYISLQ